MCGINGFNFRDHSLIESMNKSLRHRGPDSSSTFVNDSLSIGHTRLSIIDLTNEASQPMTYLHKMKTVRIVFNGEIYNYIEIKDELLQLGYNFDTLSDTEVILASYIEWGEKCVEKFNGMWAFCIYDEENEILFISRDRLGVKPLYYFCESGNFIFSSELKSILEHTSLKINRKENLNIDSVELYFSLGYIPAPNSIYKNVYKLEAGNNICYDLTKSLITKHYKFFNLEIPKPSMDKMALIEEGKSIFSDATILRMRSDVSVGAFLSGGLDSSAVVGEMRKSTKLNMLHTFSIGFDDIKLDESKYINLVKNYFGTHHHHYIYKEQDFQKLLPFYSVIFDEPFGDYSSFPAHKVSEFAKNNVKVVLSGDGGDEIFGGYPLYNIGFTIEKLKKLPIPVRKLMLKASSTLKNLTPLCNKINELIRLSMLSRDSFHVNMFNDKRYKPNVYEEWSILKMKEALALSNNNLAEALRIYDLLNNTLADNYLVKVDRTSMSNSIEVRSPFLDYRFAHFAQKIPVEFKVGIKENKILMRDLISGLVPDAILKRNKMGFTPPIHNWIYNIISPNDLKDYLNLIRGISENLFNFYSKILSNTSKNYMDAFYLIKLVIFIYWYKHWILEVNSDLDL
jgi:asparagine synthase (glutamine-hydrolysing)